MSWMTIGTMIFAVGSIFGSLVVLLCLAVSRKKEQEDEPNL